MKNRMVILHFAFLDDNKCSGVNNVVPKYIEMQKKYAEVKLVNIFEKSSDKYFKRGRFCFDALEKPFCKPDLVVFQEAHIIKYLSIYRMCLKKKIPYVIVPHGELTKYCQRQKYLKKKISDILFFNRFFKNANSFHFLSESEEKNTKNYSKYFIVSNGIDLPNSILDKKKIETEKINFTFVGRIDVYIKGIDLLYKVVSENIDYLEKKCIFNIYGNVDKKNKVRLRKIIEKYKCGELIKVNSPVFGKEKEEVYKNTDVYFQFSRTEANPTSVLEAMSYSKACLVSKNTGIGDLIVEKDGGWMCDLNTSSIFDCLRDIVEQKEFLKQKGENAYKLAKDSYSWEYSTKTILACYEKLIKI